jgi:hypothetical protein
MRAAVRPSFALFAKGGTALVRQGTADSSLVLAAFRGCEPLGMTKGWERDSDLARPWFG